MSAVSSHYEQSWNIPEDPELEQQLADASYAPYEAFEDGDPETRRPDSIDAMRREAYSTPQAYQNAAFEAYNEAKEGHFNPDLAQAIAPESPFLLNRRPNNLTANLTDAEKELQKSEQQAEFDRWMFQFNKAAEQRAIYRRTDASTRERAFKGELSNPNANNERDFWIGNPDADSPKPGARDVLAAQLAVMLDKHPNYEAFYNEWAEHAARMDASARQRREEIGVLVHHRRQAFERVVEHTSGNSSKVTSAKPEQAASWYNDNGITVPKFFFKEKNPDGTVKLVNGEPVGKRINVSRMVVGKWLGSTDPSWRKRNKHHKAMQEHQVGTEPFADPLATISQATKNEFGLRGKQPFNDPVARGGKPLPSAGSALLGQEAPVFKGYYATHLDGAIGQFREAHKEVGERSTRVDSFDDIYLAALNRVADVEFERNHGPMDLKIDKTLAAAEAVAIELEDYGTLSIQKDYELATSISELKKYIGKVDAQINDAISKRLEVKAVNFDAMRTSLIRAYNTARYVYKGARRDIQDHFGPNTPDFYGQFGSQSYPDNGIRDYANNVIYYPDGSYVNLGESATPLRRNPDGSPR